MDLDHNNERLSVLIHATVCCGCEISEISSNWLWPRSPRSGGFWISYWPMEMASSSNNNLAIPGPMLPIDLLFFVPNPSNTGLVDRWPGLLTVDHCGSQALNGHRPISVLSQPARNGDLVERVPSADLCFFGKGNICNKKGTCHETCHLDPFRHRTCLQNHDRPDQPVMQDGMPTKFNGMCRTK